jgi:alcohol dehydrogenase class IV
MMENFNFHLPTKIVFGQPVREALPTALAELNARSVLLVSDQGLERTGLVDAINDSVIEAGLEVCIYTGTTSNPTTDEVMAGLALANEQKADTIIALGGGSPIDVAKGIALLLANSGTYADYQWGGKAIKERSRPLIAVPTTAGTGSEVSKVAVVSDPANPFKKGVLSPLMFPHLAIVDPELTRELPPNLTGATGMDAFIHAIEAFVGRRANPFTDQLAQGTMRAIWNYLPQAVANGNNMEARRQMMLAALWGGMAMDHAGLGLVHALSGPLTTHLHLHHGLANGIILPHVLRFNLPAIPTERLQALQAIFNLNSNHGGEAIATTLAQFVGDLGLPTSLSQLGLSLDSVDWDKIAAETTRMVLIHNNPRAATEDDCRNLLRQMI